MEVSRPDRHRGYWLTFRVGLLLALSYSFSNMAWNYVDEYFYTNGSLAYYGVLTIACACANVMGALAGDYLAKRIRSLRQVAALGTLLSVPMVFLHWYLLKQHKAKLPTTTTQQVWVVLAGLSESLGEGMILVGAYSYVCKQATGLSSGRRFGSLALTMQFAYLFTDLWIYLSLQSSSFYALWGGVACLITAILWFLMPEPNQQVDHHDPYTERKGYSELLRGVLVFVSFACVGTGFEWGTEYVVESLNLHAHVTKLAVSMMVSSGIGASILFGWGLDSNPNRMFKIWLVAALAALVCYISAIYGFFEAMAVFTIMFCWMCSVGIEVLLLGFVTHHEKHNEISAVAAFISVWFVGGVLTFLGMKISRNPVLNLFYLGVMTLISGLLVLTRDWHVETMKNVPASPTYRQHLE